LTASLAYICATTAQLTPGDQARAHALLLDHLGIDRVHAVVGGSMGGMQALCFAALYPHRVARCVALCSTARTSATTQALRYQCPLRQARRVQCNQGIQSEASELP
jgi:homoserine acetyltransferase